MIRTILSTIFLMLATTTVALSQGIPKPALIDFDGQRTGLIGFADYKTVAAYFKSTLKGNIIPIPFNAQGAVSVKPDGSFDFTQAKYAVVTLVRYDATYGMTGFNEDPVNDAEAVKKNPRGIMPAKRVAQFWVNHLIINPVLVNPIYRNDKAFNPDFMGFFFNNIHTDDAEFAAKGKALWSSQATVSGAVTQKISYDPSQINKISSIASMNKADGSNLITLKMGISGTKPAKTFFRWPRYNILASDDAEQTVYPMTGTETVVTREFDPAVDSIQVSGNLKTYLESIKYTPTTWDLGVRWTQSVGFSYHPKKD